MLVVAVPEVDRTVVMVAGEADLATAPLLREGLLASLHHGRPSVVVDAAALAFCDLDGLDVLCGFVVIAERYGVVVTVLPSRQLAWLLTLVEQGSRTSGQADLDPSRCPLPRPRLADRLPAIRGGLRRRCG